MVEIFENIVDKNDLSELLRYMHTDDHTTDVRPDVRSNCPRWNQDKFPQAVLKRILDRVLDSYQVETVLFYNSRISFRLHVDSADGNVSRLQKNILIPLWTQGYAATVLFNNYWHGPSTRFSRTNASPFRYNLPNQQGQFVWVDDIRILLEQVKHHPESITEFEVNDKFIRDLENLISVRSKSGPGTADQRTSDYNQIINFKPNQAFDQHLHQQYVSHIPIDDLHGLTVDQVVEWQPGSVIVFDRTQLHCAASGHEQKIGVSIFTNLPGCNI
jgi:hypothetical protein